MINRTPVNLILRVWLPILILIIIIASAFIFFYRQSELKLLLEHETSEMEEVARGIALSTELALKYSDTEAIDIAVRKIAEEKNNYQVAVYQLVESGRLVLYSTWPSNLQVRLYLARPDDFVTATVSINERWLPRGYASVFLPKSSFEDMAKPLFDQLTYLIIAAVVILAFIFLNLLIQIGKPLREITDFTELLLRGDYSGHLEGTYRNSEIGRIKNALNNLKITLSREKSKNRELTTGLEFQISRKTHELKTVLDRLSAAQKIARIGNFVYWHNLNFMEMSSNMNEIMGEEIQDIDTLESFLRHVHPDFNEFVRNELLRVSKEHSRVSIDFQTVAGKDNESLWVNLVGEVISDGDAEFMAGTIQDISFRKQIEARVEQLSQVAQLTNNGVIFTDYNNLIIWANDSMSRITGYQVEEMIGKPPSMFQSEKTDPEVKTFIRSRLQELKNVRVEIQNIAKDGRDYWIELHIEPILDSLNRLKGFLAIQVDITQRKIQQQELQSTLAKQQELNQLKSRFLTMTSHEFRTPLTSIQATTEVLEILLKSDRQLEKEKIMRYLSRISGELARLTLLLNDIFSIERFEAGRIPFNPLPIDLNLVLTELLDSRTLLVNDDRVIQVIQKGSAPRSLKMDKQLISQVVTNLLTNGLKYSSGKPAPVLSLSWGQDSLILEVMDFGIGIPKIDQQNLFQTFFRASNVENIQGTGLGLVIVKQFTELHGGKIFIESDVNEGTCVKLEFNYQILESLKSNIA